MIEPNLSRNVWKPAFGHYPTLDKAKQAARYIESGWILYDPERGYKLASEPLDGYDVITRKSAGGKWAYRSDNLNTRMMIARGSQGHR